MATKRAAAWAMAGGWLVCLLGMPPVRAQEPSPSPAPASEQAGDAWITTRIRAALVPLQRGGAAQVRVATREGVVALEGVVEDRITLDAVVAAATQVRGVRGVDAQGLHAGTAAVP